MLFRSRIRPADDVRQTLTDRLRMNVELSVRRYLSDLYQTLPFVLESRQSDVENMTIAASELTSSTDAAEVKRVRDDLETANYRLRQSTDAAARLESGKHSRQTAEFCQDWRLFHSLQMKSSYTAIPEYFTRDNDSSYRVPVSQILTVRRCL